MSLDLHGARIALDLDDTLLRTKAAFAGYIEATLGRTVDPDPATYDLADAGWFETRQDFTAIWQAAVIEGMYENLPAYPGAVKALCDLQAAGARIVVVTARSALDRAVTTRNLAHLGLSFEDIFFTPAKWTVPADIYLDDAPFVLTELDRRGLPRLAHHHRYNEMLGGPRFTSWTQVPALVAEALTGVAPSLDAA